MGFFSKIFRKKENISLDPGLLERLNDDNLQNELIPENLWDMIETSKAPDDEPINTDEVGKCTDSPIRVNGPIGELCYLSRLLAPNNLPIFFHRIGCVGTNIYPVDIYEIVSIDGSYWDFLLFDFYYLSKTTLLPKNYHRKDRIEGFMGINQFIEEFPKNIYSAMLEHSPLPCINPLCRNIDTREFYSPPYHTDLKDQLVTGLRPGGVPLLPAPNAFIRFS